MWRVFGLSVLVSTCLLLGGCLPLPRLSEVLDVVGAAWKDADPPSKDTGGPTVVRPTLTSNSSVSFDIEITEVEAGYALDEVAQLAVFMDQFSGHYLFNVGDDNRTPTGSILVTVVQEQPPMPDVQGEFKLRVVAADAAGLVGDAVEVPAAFFAASAGEDSMVVLGQTVVLDATFTGATGTPDVTWSQVSGPAVTIEDPSAASTTFVPQVAGTYVMKLEAVDPTGVIDVDLVSILVVEEFTVDAGESDVVVVGETVQLRGLAAGGVGQATFAWTEISAFGVTIEDSTSRVASFGASATGEYEFEVAATDEMAGTVMDRVIYLAVDGLTALASAPAEPQQPGATILLQGQAAGGLYPYAFRWTQTAGPAVEIEDSTNQTAIVLLQAAGEYTFELRVEDSTGSAATDSAITVVEPCQDDSACDDDNLCTNDACVDGECYYTDVCDPGKVCDPATGNCLDCQEDADCDDGDLCTDDTCEDDACVYTPVDCDNGAFCDGVETCDPQTGACVDNEDPCDPASESCDEVNDECTEVEPPCTDDASCDDGAFCNGEETCVNGSCVPGTDPCGPDELCDEQNDECLPGCSGSDTICSSRWLTGIIDPVADQDSYTFTGQAGDVIFIQANRTLDSLNPQIRLYPPSGEREALAGDSYWNDHSVASLFEHTLLESGQYSILILDDGLNHTGEYVLSLLNLSGALTSSQDPDGGAAAYGDTKTGAIDPVADQDAYTFTGHEGDIIFIQANRTSGSLNPQIRLYPPSGEREALAGDSYWNDHSVASLFEHTLLESGQYTIVILDDGLNHTGEYVLSLDVLP